MGIAMIVPSQYHTTQTPQQPAPFYFRGMKREECVAPIPGRPCLTGLLEVKLAPHLRCEQASINVLRDRELSQVVADHLRLDLDRVKLLAGVDTDDGADHLGDDDHVTQVGLDDGRLLVWRGLLLRLAELLNQAHGLALQATVEPTAGAGVDDIAQLLAGEVEEPVPQNWISMCPLPKCSKPNFLVRVGYVDILIQVDAAVGELSECSLGLEGCITNILSADILSSSAPLWPIHRVSSSVECVRRRSQRSAGLASSWWCAHTGSLLGVLEQLSAFASFAHARFS